MSLPLMITQHELAVVLGVSSNNVLQKMWKHGVPNDRVSKGLYLIDWQEYLWRVPMSYRYVPHESVVDWVREHVESDDFNYDRDCSISRRLWSWANEPTNPRRYTFEDYIWELGWLRIEDVISDGFIDLMDFHVVSKSTLKEITDGEYAASTA